MTTLMLMLSIHAGHSKNLGQYGHVFPITEVNMLDFIYDRLVFLDRTGVLAELKKKAIVDANGKRLYTKGTTYNAMDTKTYPKSLTHLYAPRWTGCLVLFDGDDHQQLNWMKQQLPKWDKAGQSYYLMLTGGNIKTSSAYLQRPVRFNQHGWLSNKLGIRHVPSFVIQEDARFKITEVDVSKLPLTLQSEVA